MPLKILTLTQLPIGGYTGTIIVNGCLYAGTFIGEMQFGNTIVNFNIIKIMRQVQLLEDMKSCITQGQKTIPAGTVMTKFYTQLSWTYYKDAIGNTLIIMGFASDDWNKVKAIN